MFKNNSMDKNLKHWMINRWYLNYKNKLNNSIKKIDFFKAKYKNKIKNKSTIAPHQKYQIMKINFKNYQILNH